MGCRHLKCSLEKSTLSEDSPTPRICSTKINLDPSIVYFSNLSWTVPVPDFSRNSDRETLGMESSLFFHPELWLRATGTRGILGSPLRIFGGELSL